MTKTKKHPLQKLLDEPLCDFDIADVGVACIG